MRCLAPTLVLHGLLSLLLLARTSSSPPSSPGSSSHGKSSSRSSPVASSLDVGTSTSTDYGQHLFRDSVLGWRPDAEAVRGSVAKLVSWMEEGGASFGRVGVSTFSNPYYVDEGGAPVKLLGLAARAAIGPGESFMRVPAKFIISNVTAWGSKTLGPWLRKNRDCEWVQHFAASGSLLTQLYFMVEKANHENSFFKPYLDTIPQSILGFYQLWADDDEAAAEKGKVEGAGGAAVGKGAGKGAGNRTWKGPSASFRDYRRYLLYKGYSMLELGKYYPPFMHLFQKHRDFFPRKHFNAATYLYATLIYRTR